MLKLIILLGITICAADEYVLYTSINKYYKFSTTSMNWNDARELCESDGGRLGLPQNPDQHEFFSRIFKDAPIIAGASYSTDMFVGFHDLFKANKYITLYGNQPLPSYLKWANGEPNSPGDHCGAINKNGLLHDDPCSWKLPFICEKDVVKSDKYRLYPNINMYYKFSTTPRSWNDARKLCEGDGGRLGFPQNPDQYEIFSAIFKNAMKIGGASYENDMFVGFHDLFEANEYITLYGNQPLPAFLKWANGEPNSATDHCGAIDKNGLLHDDPCSWKLPFICEKDAENFDDYKSLTSSDQNVTNF